MDPAQYLVLAEIPLVSGSFSAGEVLVEGQNIPVGWEPVAGMVDPLNPRAVLAYHRTRPTPPSAYCKIVPKTFWKVEQQLPTCTLWRLTGLGVGLDPVGI
jgi:hypothetical protein